MCKVSVVIPVYNADKYLRECLETVKNQTLMDIQVILVDDGSTDDSVSILNEYVNKDSRFMLIKQQNQFAGIARNSGMKYAKGEYICFLDSDDIFEVAMLEEMYQNAIANNSDIVLCDAYFFDNLTKEIQEPSWLLKAEYIPAKKTCFSSKDIPDKIFQVTSPAPWNKLYKKAFVDNHGLLFQGTKQCNDDYFVSMTMVLAEQISVVNKRFIYYRTNNISSLQGMGNPQEASYDFYYALMAIQKDLITRKLYQSVERSFVNKCVSVCIAALKKQKYYSNFSKIYNFIKEKALYDLKIDISDPIFFYSNINYQMISKILEYSPEEFIYQEYINSNNSKGEHYAFPFEKLNGARKIALYGAGSVGKSFWRQIVRNNYYNLTAWFDIQYNKYQALGLQVFDVNNIMEFEFEKIIIAIEDKQVAKLVYYNLINLGVSESKIIYGI